VKILKESDYFLFTHPKRNSFIHSAISTGLVKKTIKKRFICQIFWLKGKKTGLEVKFSPPNGLWLVMLFLTTIAIVMGIKTWIGLGLMSGTSLDGLDLAAVSLTESAEGWDWELLAARTETYSDEWTERLARLPLADAPALAKAHTDYAHWLGMAVRRFGIEQGIQPDFVACHGHTVFHQPHRHFTFQLGDGETLANYCRVPLVCNFRPRDVGQGGQGAPLAPLADSVLFPGCKAFLNLGGIANISLFFDSPVDPELGVWQKNRTQLG
jgi:hypothetical protein